MSNTKTAITWQTKNLTIEQIDSIIGMGRKGTADELLRTCTSINFSSRARGYWDANERELHAAYRSLEQIAKERTAA